MLHDNGDGTITLKWSHSCTDFIKDDPKGVDIAPLIAGTTLRLLWGDIEWSTKPPTGERVSGDP